MNKKDRIAVVISVVYILGLVLPTAFNSSMGAIIYFLLLICYWGYRFIKNDISFLNILISIELFLHATLIFLPSFI